MYNAIRFLPKVLFTNLKMNPMNVNGLKRIKPPFSMVDHKQQVPKYTISMLLIVSIVFFFSIFTATAQTNVNLKPYTVRDIGGYTEVQDLFSMMTGNMDSRAKPFMRDANSTGIREILN